MAVSVRAAYTELPSFKSEHHPPTAGTLISRSWGAKPRDWGLLGKVMHGAFPGICIPLFKGGVPTQCKICSEDVAFPFCAFRVLLSAEPIHSLCPPDFSCQHSVCNTSYSTQAFPFSFGAFQIPSCLRSSPVYPKLLYCLGLKTSLSSGV